MSNPVLEGKEPFMTFTIHTSSGPQTFGKLWLKMGVWSFEGIVDQSAKIFIDYLVDRLNNPSKYEHGP